MPTQTMNVKEHFKMYKSGKRWLYASLAAATLLSGGVVLSQPASADEVSTTTTQAQEQTEAAASSTQKNAYTTANQGSTVSDTAGTSTAQTTNATQTTAKTENMPKVTEKTSGNVTKIAVDDTNLNRAVTDAKNEGVKVNQDPTQKLNGNLSDKDDLIQQVADDYSKQTDTLNAATAETKQYKTNVANAEKSNQTVQDTAKAAKEAGVDVTQEDNKQSQSFDDINKDNANQVASLTADMKKQQALNDAYNSAKSAADAANAAAKAKYDTEMAEYNQILADLESKTNQNGYAKEVLSQELLLKAESHAKVTITAPGVKWDQDWSHPSVSDTPIVNTDAFYANSKNADGQPVQWYSAWLEPGQSVTVDYTDLSNSSYQSQPITKIQKTFTNTSNFKENLGIPSDPTMNVWYIDSQIGQDRQRTVKEVRVLYGQDGQPIKLGKDALISLGSLNAWYDDHDGQHVEAVKVDNSHFVSITGGTINYHSDGWAYSDTDNASQDGSWDDPSNPNFYKGAAIFQLDGDDQIVINYRTDSGANDSNNTTWAYSATTIPVQTLPKKPTLTLVDEPKKPDAVKSSYHLYEMPKYETASVSYHKALIAIDQTPNPSITNNTTNNYSYTTNNYTTNNITNNYPQQPSQPQPAVAGSQATVSAVEQAAPVLPETGKAVGNSNEGITAAAVLATGTATMFMAMKRKKLI
ncbi:hypothetical protein FFRU_120410 [Fructobacillus fructosus]|uniref:GbpC/Spa domain-containing protein n=4 Tax=Fructobacillus fructosus TaxID=1631 RepID=UPI0002195907|nr:GbpC/Spa domain-containing protein [Fructobacillus fructosus]GAP01781.1 hypothetical protein FFRU_120410 [Fructobacillus fructosus]